MTIYVIHDPKQGYWHNDKGWCQKEIDASFFTQEERNILNLPNTIGSVANWKVTNMTKKQLFARLYRSVHKDFKGRVGDYPTIMSYAKYGGGLVGSECITDAELCERLETIN